MKNVYTNIQIAIFFKSASHAKKCHQMFVCAAFAQMHPLPLLLTTE